MPFKRYFSLRFIIFVPLILALSAVIVIVGVYVGRAKQQAEDEFFRIQSALTRAAKVVTALDYSLSNQLDSGHGMRVAHEFDGGADYCYIRPAQEYIRAKEKETDIPAVDIDYMITARPALCREVAQDNPVFDRISFAPFLSFLKDLDPNIFSVRYADRSGYVLSSPKCYAEQMSQQELEQAMQHPYWFITSEDRRSIEVSGPEYHPEFDRNLLSYVTSVTRKGKQVGLLALDIDLHVLLTENYYASRPVEIISMSEQGLPANVFWARKLEVEGLHFEHVLLYPLDWSYEMVRFVEEEKYGLLLTLILSLLSVVFFFYANSNIEKLYFKDMASRDPMTGLLNRRGMEEYWGNLLQGVYRGVMVLDLDDFKKINDRYGHDCGDKVICYVARRLQRFVGERAAAARFGGEEFVVAFSSDSQEEVYEWALQVHKAVSDGSAGVVKNGFTASGGVSVSRDKLPDFVALFKAADNNLYRAKENGKNQVIF